MNHTPSDLMSNVPITTPPHPERVDFLLVDNSFLGVRRAYMHVVPTLKMEVAFLSSFVVVVRHWNSVLLVSRGQQRQLYIRLTERELNGIAVIHFPSMIAEIFRESIDELHYNCH